MEDLFKKVIYTGFGFVSTATERIQKNIDELVEQGSLTKAEGRKVVDDLFENTEAKKEEFESKIKEIVTDVMNRLQLPRKSEIQKLVDRIAELEAKLGIENDENIMKG